LRWAPCRGAPRVRAARLPPFLLHAPADLALDERFHKHGQEIDEEEGLDPVGALQIDGHDLEDGFQLLVSLLHTGLVLVGQQSLTERKLFVIEEQRKDSVRAVIVLQRRWPE
jgi:hypothetical protein